MPDFRHHIAYLCAVFLMLGFGILIGESFYAPDQVSRQGKQIANLRVQVDGAVQDGRKAKEQLDKVEEAVESLRQSLVRGKLSGKKIAVIQTGDYPEATQSAVDAIRDSGGTVTATVVVNEKTTLLTIKQKDAVVAALAPTDNVVPTPADGANVPQDPSTDGEDNIRIIDAIADLVAKGTGPTQDNGRALLVLERQGLVTVTGDLTLPATLCVLVGGGKDDVPGFAGPDARQPFDGLLIDRLRESSGGLIAMVGSEPLDAVTSFVTTYQKYGIPTVDCMDKPLGRLDLPYALRGEAADYGFKTTANRRIPISLEEGGSL